MSTGPLFSCLRHLAVAFAMLAGATTALAQAAPPGPPPGAPPENPLMLKKVADAEPGEIRLMVTAAFMQPIEAVREKAEEAIGRPIFVEYGSARGNLRDEILGGQDFEVAILLPDVTAELRREGKLSGGDHDIAQVEVAIALRGDVEVDISTPQALKRTLLGASAVRYSPTGVARPTVRKLLDELGIADAINDYSNRPPSFEPVPPGEYEINLFPLSEVARMRGLTNLGLVIEPFQSPERITAVVGAHANDREAAEALVRFLQSSVLDAPVREAGMSRR